MEAEEGGSHTPLGRLQERYGIASEESNRQLDNFIKVVVQLRKSNAKLIVLQKRLRDVKAVRRKTKSMKS
ncbi:MAG TPA: hypothetical protein VMH23_08590 [Bacteroidota bacterium]|nr:hypothetical protein [Bacteroidota bacterium]